MDISNEEEILLKSLVKTSRQRTHQVGWTDRDGTKRLTTLSQADLTIVQAIARRLRVNPPDVMRMAAHIPVTKPAPASADAAQTESSEVGRTVPVRST
jgi:hypothetical protein